MVKLRVFYFIEGKEAVQSAGSKATEGSSTSEGHTPLVYYHELVKQSADKLNLQVR